MAKLSRLGDENEMAGKILRGADSVFANGIKVGLHLSEISKHRDTTGGGGGGTGGGGESGSGSTPDAGGSFNDGQIAQTTDGSPTVFAEGCPVLRVGSGNTCGHHIVQGSDDVFVP